MTTRPFGRGNLYHLLSNPIYVGSIRHRDMIYDGEHKAIIDRKLFDDVQQLLKAQAPDRRSPSNQADGHLLTGILSRNRRKAESRPHQQEGRSLPLLCVQGAGRRPGEGCRWLEVTGKRS